jgi:hypothetical protein
MVSFATKEPYLRFVLVLLEHYLEHYLYNAKTMHPRMCLINGLNYRRCISDSFWNLTMAVTQSLVLRKFWKERFSEL